MFEAIAGVLEAGLTLWNTLEANKYRDKLTALRRAWYEEYNKDANARSDAVLDAIMFELFNLGAGFSATIRTQNSKN